ncbi:MAG TPA: VOC family protein [Acidimicrobiia bacterium]|nr:VOC family protein [Acidimicrobiia bacterium]
MPIGQVILGTRDLDAAAAKLRADGLAVLDGGVHPGLGTANRIVPLGDSYLEVLGVIDEAEARAQEYGRALLRETEAGDRFVRWSIRTEQIDVDAARLGLVPERRSRRRPDGSLLSWQAAGLEGALAEPWLPFFMQWDRTDDFPGAAPVAHPVGPCSLAWIEVSTPDPARLEGFVGDHDVGVRIVGGEPGIHAAAIAIATGEWVLRP